MTSKQWVILVVVAIVFAGGGFFGGVKYQQGKTPAVAARPGGAAGFAGRRAGGAGGGASFVSGQVLSSDSSTITVKNMAGGSEIVILAPSTQYRKAVDGSASDVTVGSMVTVTGSTNSDGSLTAQSVQIRAGTSTPTSTSTTPAQ
jgi:hypothetical protein